MLNALTANGFTTRMSLPLKWNRLYPQNKNVAPIRQDHEIKAKHFTLLNAQS